SGRREEAVLEYRACLKEDPGDTEAHYRLGVLLAQLGKASEAVAHFRFALAAPNPRWTEEVNRIAWRLAPAPEPSRRDGAPALELAQLAFEASGSSEPRYLDTLGAAYAECGRFADAASAARRALELARSGVQEELTREIRERLRRYEARQPFHQSR